MSGPADAPPPASLGREDIHARQLLERPEKFADHYSQARLFFISQRPAEQRHMVDAFRFN